MIRFTSRLGLAGISLLVATALPAQVTSTMRTVTLSATKGQYVTLTAPTNNDQTVALIDGDTARFPNPIETTVGWDVTTTSTTVKLVAYFGSATAALTNGTSNIPSSLIEISTDNGSTWNPVSGGVVGSVGTANASLTLYESGATSGGNKTGSHLVSFQIRVNLTTNPGTISGVYTGTLNLMAICN